MSQKCRPKVFHCMKSTDIRCPCLRCLFLEQRSKLKRTHQSVSRQFVDLSKALLKKNGKTQRQDSCAKPVTRKVKKKRKSCCITSKVCTQIYATSRSSSSSAKWHGNTTPVIVNISVMSQQLKKKKKKERTCLGSCQDTGGVSSNFTRVYRYTRKRQHYYTCCPFPLPTHFLV